MPSTSQNFIVYQGADHAFEFFVVDDQSPAQPLDVSSGTLDWYVSEGADQIHVEDSSIGHSDGNGVQDKVSITLNATELAKLARGTHSHQLWYTTSGGSPKPIATGIVTVNRSL